MDMNNVLSIYGCTDASVTFKDKTGRLKVYEYERHAKVRNAMYSERHDVHWKEGTNDNIRRSFIEKVKDDMGGRVDVVLYSMITDRDIDLLKSVLGDGVEFKFMDGHNEYHMMSGYGMSGYSRASVVIVDGPGIGSKGIEFSKFYIVNDYNIEFEDVYHIDLVGPYGWL